MVNRAVEGRRRTSLLARTHFGDPASPRMSRTLVDILTRLPFSLARMQSRFWGPGCLGLVSPWDSQRPKGPGAHSRCAFARVGTWKNHGFSITSAKAAIKCCVEVTDCIQRNTTHGLQVFRPRTRIRLSKSPRLQGLVRFSRWLFKW
jgi:hypothetical protein